MPPPPSDAELLAGFTDQEKEFLAWYERDDVHRAMSDPDFNIYRGLIKAQWPDPDIKAQWHTWVRKWAGRYKARTQYQMSTNEFIDFILETDFSSEGSIGSFDYVMEMHNNPFILLGESDCGHHGKLVGYGLYPADAVLCANGDTSDDMGFGRPGLQLGRCVMVLDPNVQVPPNAMPIANLSPRKRNREASGSSGRINPNARKHSVQSDDSGFPEPKEELFFFAQLGHLCIYTGPSWDKARNGGYNPEMSGPWDGTSFVVVLKLGDRGEKQSVWVIYNFHEPEDDEASCNLEQEHIITVGSDGNLFPDIGRLHKGCDKIFTVAKIADGLKEFKENPEGAIKRLEFDPLVKWGVKENEKEWQIFRAKIEAGRLVPKDLK